MRELKKIEDLRDDPSNANLGTVRGSYQLQESMQNHGAGRGVVVDANGYILAGNKTVEIARELGIPILVVQTHGERVLAVKRKDMALSRDYRAREIAYADNVVPMNSLAWDHAQITRDVARGVPLTKSGFKEEDILKIVQEYRTALDRAETERRRQEAQAQTQVQEDPEHEDTKTDDAPTKHRIKLRVPAQTHRRFFSALAQFDGQTQTDQVERLLKLASGAHDTA